MLAHLEAKLAQFGIANIDIHVMDGAALEFRRDYFHQVACSLGLDRFPAPSPVISECRRVLRPGGRFGCSSLASSAFQPQLELLRQQLGQRDHCVLDLPWVGTATSQALSGLLTAAGFVDIAIHEFNMGYRLGDAEQWWDVVQYSSLRRWLEPLTPKEVQDLRSRHLREIASLVTADGLWLDVPVVMATGCKP
jgi:SAM-dependent methyltransferase